MTLLPRDMINQLAAVFVAFLFTAGSAAVVFLFETGRTADAAKNASDINDKRLDTLETRFNEALYEQKELKRHLEEDNSE